MAASTVLPNFFRPTAPFFGTMLVSTECVIGTGGVSISDTTTTTYLLPKPACTSCQLVGVAFSALVAGVSAGQTVTIQVFKRDNSGTPADRTLTATKSVLADVIATTDKTFPVPITATSAANVTFAATDACRIDAVASGAVSTQPTMVVEGLWAIITP